MKFNEKIETLKTHFKERFEYADEIRKGISEQLNTLQENRKNVADSIEKYKDDEFVTKILLAQKQYMDDNFDKTYQNLKIELEDFEKQFPLMERFIELVDEHKFNKETLEVYIDLFTSQLLRDIKERKELMEKEKSEKK